LAVAQKKKKKEEKESLTPTVTTRQSKQLTAHSVPTCFLKLVKERHAGICVKKIIMNSLQ